MIWKPLYNTWEINHNGAIRNKFTSYVLKFRQRRDGYIDVKLGYKRHLVHRLVALIFIPNPENKKQVNHINGNRKDYRIENLEWVTQKENMQHAITIGIFPDRRKEKNGRATITEETAQKIKKLLAAGLKSKQIAEKFNISIYVVANIKNGKCWVYNE